VPMVAASVSILLPRWLAAGVAAAFLVVSLIWIAGIHSRPVARRVDGRVQSIFRADRTQLLFANGPQLQGTYTRMASDLADLGCSQVGILLGGDGAEYPLWSVLGAPRDSLRIEWIVSGTASARYAPSDFVPCGVICQDCPRETVKIRGLPQAYDLGGFQLFLGLPAGG